MRQDQFYFENEGESLFADEFEAFENEYDGEFGDYESDEYGEDEYEDEFRQQPLRGARFSKKSPVFRPRPRPRKPSRPRRPRSPYPVGLPYFSVSPTIAPGSDNPELVRVIQSLLNKTLNLNLPVDGVMNVETRSAIRSFQNQQGSTGAKDDGSSEPAASADGAANQPAAADDTDKPEGEYDEYEFYDSEDEWFEQEFETGSASISVPSIQDLRQNMVRIAQQEWQRWGKGAIKESDPKMRGVLEDYWKNGAGYKPSRANWWSSVPWSAAFISWVVKKAGGGKAFTYSGGHSYYIKAAKDNRRANNSNPFKAYRINEIAPEPGDLVCACRESCRATYDTIAPGLPTHCDIVTEKHPGYIVVIGGNVGNTVGRKTVPTDERGFIKATKFFTVIRASDQRSATSAPKYQHSAPASSGGVPDIVTVRGIQVARQIAPQIEQLLAASARDGVNLSGGGYRSSEQQIKLRIAHCGGNTPYNIYEKPSSQCTPPTAPPGRSNHEKGLAIDFKYNGQGIKTRDNPGFKWLAANAAKYGLYNLPSEPWHWSINGK